MEEMAQMAQMTQSEESILRKAVVPSDEYKIALQEFKRLRKAIEEEEDASWKAFFKDVFVVKVVAYDEYHYDKGYDSEEHTTASQFYYKYKVDSTSRNSAKQIALDMTPTYLYYDSDDDDQSVMSKSVRIVKKSRQPKTFPSHQVSFHENRQIKSHNWRK
jgi:hypothetical protein